jgi:hypothetical protein
MPSIQSVSFFKNGFLKKILTNGLVDTDGNNRTSWVENEGDGRHLNRYIKVYRTNLGLQKFYYERVPAVFKLIKSNQNLTDELSELSQINQDNIVAEQESRPTPSIIDWDQNLGIPGVSGNSGSGGILIEEIENGEKLEFQVPEVIWEGVNEPFRYIVIGALNTISGDAEGSGHLFIKIELNEDWNPDGNSFKIRCTNFPSIQVG